MDLTLMITAGLLVLYGVLRSIHAIADALSIPVTQHQDASCGSCGYAVEGLTAATCPECGSNLLDVGIVGRRGINSMRRSPGRRFAEAIAGWTFICIVMLCVAAVINAGVSEQWLVVGGLLVWLPGLFVIGMVSRRRGSAQTHS